jgi:hypothetical protein
MARLRNSAIVMPITPETNEAAAPLSGRVRDFQPVFQHFKPAAYQPS